MKTTAAVTETNREFYDTFDGPKHRVSVELCHGVWHTFSRYLGMGDASVKKHASREAARTYARGFAAL